MKTVYVVYAFDYHSYDEILAVYANEADAYRAYDKLLGEYDRVDYKECVVNEQSFCRTMGINE